MQATHNLLAVILVAIGAGTLVQAILLYSIIRLLHDTRSFVVGIHDRYALEATDRKEALNLQRDIVASNVRRQSR